MVKGFQSFSKWFQGYEKEYAIIGGTACDLLMAEEGLTFRATKDIDMVLIIESLTPEFGQKFWQYIIQAGYLILFKAKAWLDLSAQKKNGEDVDSKHLRKHKNDVFRLSALLGPGTQIHVSPQIFSDIQSFITAMGNESVDEKQLGLLGTKESILQRINVTYIVSEE